MLYNNTMKTTTQQTDTLSKLDRFLALEGADEALLNMSEEFKQRLNTEPELTDIINACAEDEYVDCFWGEQDILDTIEAERYVYTDGSWEDHMISVALKCFEGLQGLNNPFTDKLDLSSIIDTDEVAKYLYHSLGWGEISEHEKLQYIMEMNWDKELIKELNNYDTATT